MYIVWCLKNDDYLITDSYTAYTFTPIILPKVNSNFEKKNEIHKCTNLNLIIIWWSISVQFMSKKFMSKTRKNF